jgi:hypothetical protein
MNAQPSDAPAARSVVSLPRTIRAVREALPAEMRARFAAEMDTGEQPATFEAWWMCAVVYSSPRTVVLLEQAHAGTLKTVPAAQVFGDRWPAA